MAGLTSLVMLSLALVVISGSGQDATPRPYVDENGDICVDSVDLVKELDHVDEIHCNVDVGEVCDSEASPRIEEEEEERCDTTDVMECKTVYRPKTTVLKVKVCPGATRRPSAIDVGSAVPKFTGDLECVDGQKKVCQTEHETVCNTAYVKNEMLDDRPVCNPTKVDKCDEFGRCRKFTAAKCQIERRTVIRPETKCERVPRSYCRTVACDSSDSSPTTRHCYFKYQPVNDVASEEECELKPRTSCRSTSRIASRLARRRDSGGRGRSKAKTAFRRRRRPVKRKKVAPTTPTVLETESWWPTPPPALRFGEESGKEPDLPDVDGSAAREETRSEIEQTRDRNGQKRVDDLERNKNCRMEAKQTCKRVRVNSKPVWRERIRRLCRPPRGKADADLVSELLENRKEETPSVAAIEAK